MHCFCCILAVNMLSSLLSCGQPPPAWSPRGHGYFWHVPLPPGMEREPVLPLCQKSQWSPEMAARHSQSHLPAATSVFAASWDHCSPLAAAFAAGNVFSPFEDLLKKWNVGRTLGYFLSLLQAAWQCRNDLGLSRVF